MSVTPEMCRCGEAQCARQDIKDRWPKPGRCHICRAIAMYHKDWSEERVTAAGKRKWRAITPKVEA